ncbi:FkbM family methyltransferase [Streptomyces cinnabarinus]|uniref:FkbM family methyltransferase n=1 Tax=Streptomyces cinnabarinus TaxID=67287 RepID=A0ABY7KBN2_9ACTN|nr:FkbM family methyltransferase [Streptomyces cinnabarinus]WAZ20171.1 FkbM family methyltransferase [Streptomyces cinnabarinus]
MSPTVTGPAPGDPEAIQRILFGFRGALAFDVGGNWGVVARRLAANFTRVISFEPAAESYGILVDAANDTPGLEAVQLALSDRDGEVVLAAQENSIRTGQLTTPDPDGEPDSLTESTWGRVLERRSVPCARLDDLDDRYGTPDFIKVDVEGHEVAVIQGGLTLLETARPQLFIEVHSAGLGAQLGTLLRRIYGEHLHVVRHPHYPAGSWGHDNHYYLIAGPAASALAAPRRPLVPVGRRKETAVPAGKRDIEADYRNAYIDEYEAYRTAGRDEEADRVAHILRDQYGHDVDAADVAAEPDSPVERPEANAPETTAVAPPPEAAVEPKPAAKKAVARKTAANKPAPKA